MIFFHWGQSPMKKNHNNKNIEYIFIQGVRYMFNVTIIKLKDIIKIGVILILIYVFSNFILKTFKENILLSYSIKFDSVDFVKRGIEKESSIINNILNNNSLSNENIKLKEKNYIFLDIKSILNVGSNMFSLKPSEKIDDGQDGDKKNRY